MAKVHGVAGEWARVKGTVVGLWPLFLSAVLIGFALALCLFVSLLAGIVVLTLSLLGACWGLFRGVRLVERFFKGARGEERVAGILQSLPAAYHVFNDFIVGRNHVDHVVVGPAGVFAVETKFWKGAVTIEDGHILLDGQLPSRSPLSQAVREAELVRAALATLGWTGSVTPVLTFASDTFTAHAAELQGAVVINSCELKKSFEGGRSVLSPTELDRLVHLMESNT